MPLNKETLKSVLCDYVWVDLVFYAKYKLAVCLCQDVMKCLRLYACMRLEAGRQNKREKEGDPSELQTI